LRRHTRKFVRTYLTLAISLLGGLVVFNTLADPYNVYPALHLNALVPHKPNNDHRRAKAGIVRQQQGWHTLIMGSSYAVVGMDATHPTLQQPAFNLGLNGGKLEEQLGALHYASRFGHPIKHIILIYDNQWLFQAATPSVDYLQSPFNPNYSSIEYQGSNLLGMQSTEHAWHAVRQWLRDGPPTDDPLGRRLKPLLPSGISQRRVFDDFLSTPDLDRPTDGDADNLDLFQQFAGFCLENDIALTVLIAPAHVSLLEKFDASGYWPDWLAGQRRLLALAQRLNHQNPNTPPITIWDFNSITPYTTEPIPPLSDTTTRLKWFWDPGHFRKELGDVMLNRAFEHDNPDSTRFGTRLTRETIEPYLKQIRNDYERYISNFDR
jgi:hypothetical protein